MVNSTNQHSYSVGDRVRVPWGLDELEGEIVQVWGDPPAHIRVAVVIEEGEEPEVLLLNLNVVSPAA